MSRKPECASADVVEGRDRHGDAKAGAAVTSEVLFETRQNGNNQSQCLVFAWVEAQPRKNGQVFTCDDVAGVDEAKEDLQEIVEFLRDPHLVGAVVVWLAVTVALIA